MKKFNFKLVVLDLDGTLVDSVPDLAFCVNELMRVMERDVWEDAKIRQWVGNGVVKLIERSLTGKLNAKVDENNFNKAYSIFLELYAKNTCKRSFLYKGVRQGLAYLKSQNIIIGCVTNKAEQFTLPILKKLEIFDYFAMIISGNTLMKTKPDPLPLLHIAKHFNIPPQHCLMVGDSISDVKASRAAGFSIICVSYGYNHGIDIAKTKPDAVIDSLTELKNYT